MKDETIKNFNMKKIITIILLLMTGAVTSYPADYFWVGGSGNWSEISHWAITSGGTTTHLVVPTMTCISMQIHLTKTEA